MGQTLCLVFCLHFLIKSPKKPCVIGIIILLLQLWKLMFKRLKQLTYSHTVRERQHWDLNQIPSNSNDTYATLGIKWNVPGRQNTINPTPWQKLYFGDIFFCTQWTLALETSRFQVWEVGDGKRKMEHDGRRQAFPVPHFSPRHVLTSS